MAARRRTAHTDGARAHDAERLLGTSQREYALRWTAAATAALLPLAASLKGQHSVDGRPPTYQPPSTAALLRFTDTRASKVGARAIMLALVLGLER